MTTACGTEAAVRATHRRWSCTICDFPIACRIEHGHLSKSARVDDVPVRNEQLILSVRVEGYLPVDADDRNLGNFWNYASLATMLRASEPIIIRDAIEHEVGHILRRIEADMAESPMINWRVVVKVRRPGLIPPAAIEIEVAAEGPRTPAVKAQLMSTLFKEAPACH